MDAGGCDTLQCVWIQVQYYVSLCSLYPHFDVNIGFSRKNGRIYPVVSDFVGHEPLSIKIEVHLIRDLAHQKFSGRVPTTRIGVA